MRPWVEIEAPADARPSPRRCRNPGSVRLRAPTARSEIGRS